MNDALDILEGDISIAGGRIQSIAPHIDEPHDTVVDARGGFVLPGFVQTHVHLCQTLFRGYADDLPLMEWLRRRIWPMEAAHTPATLRAASRAAAMELLSGGTTSVLTMETVHDTDAVFDAIAESGMRATIGKCMMDRDADAPARLHESTRASIDGSLALRKRWNGAANGRVRAAFAPRFALSCSRELLESVAHLSSAGSVLVHTHASESRDELDEVRRISGGLSHLRYLDQIGLTSSRLCAAHCVWVDEDERALIADRGVKVLHCPGSNLKLGSGIAPITEMRALGITVSLGADGAACNNHLDMFEEMRLAALLQSVRHRPGSLPARDVLWMATRGGAQTVGLDAEIGSLESGKRADLIVVDRDNPRLANGPDVYAMLVYAGRASDVRTTVVDGELLVDGFKPTWSDPADVAAEARTAARQVAQRAGLSG